MNVLNAQFLSSIKIDQILGTYTGSFISTAPTAGGFSTTDTAIITTNIADTTFFQGIYSIDNGTTWNDFCNQQLILPPDIFFPFLTVTGKSTSNTFTVKSNNFYNYNTSTGTQYTVLYKVCLIAKPNQGTITPQSIGTNTFFKSKFNYQKIAVDGSNSVSIGSSGSGTFTIAHSLGYIPKIRPFFQLNSDSSMNELVNSNLGTPDISIDNNNVYITLNAPIAGLVGTLYTRVYYDA